MPDDRRTRGPHISLITSWMVPMQNCGTDELPLGITAAVEMGLPLLDLYFLDHADIPWYAAAAKCPREQAPGDPHAFVAGLRVPEIEQIFKALSVRLDLSRLRFAAFATFFPLISLPDGEGKPPYDRHGAVRALRNTLYLAGLLGVPCVEIVGGARIPVIGADGRPKLTAPVDCYDVCRRRELARSLAAVYHLEDPDNPLRQLRTANKSLPVVAMELEPGSAFLMNSLEEYGKLCQAVQDCPDPGANLAVQHVKLNVDIAHAFLIGYTVDDLQPIKQHIAHMHISDHAGHYYRRQPQGTDYAVGVHAMDLVPGTFHRPDEYQPWLALAQELLDLPGGCFSRAIAIEMEACNNPGRIVEAYHTVQSWMPSPVQCP